MKETRGKGRNTTARECAFETGEEQPTNDYRKMMNGNWEKVKEIFDAALQRNPEERPQFLAEVCADNEAMRCEVESLLASFEQAESFMQKPLAGNLA